MVPMNSIMMMTLDFRQILTEIATLDRQGVASFDSGHVSVRLKCSVAEASKRLSRLHGMGFLKRRRLKRLCTSKHGKTCRKGYRYEYSFSAQGRKYIQYMAGLRMVEAAFYYEFFKQAIPHLDQESKTQITNLTICNDSRTFKGSNQALQTLGLASTITIPQLARKISENNRENLGLLRAEVILRDTITKQATTIEKLQILATTLAMTLGNRDETISSLRELLQNLLFQNQLINVPMTLLSAYKGIVNDLTLALFFMNPENGLKLVEHYSNRQRPIIQKAEEQLEACRARLQKTA
jgi:hypothetical protein